MPSQQESQATTRTLSHSATPLLKFGIPVLWLLLSGWAALQLWGAPEELAYGTTPANSRWLVAGMWALSSAALLIFAGQLRRVRLLDGMLYASNYRTEIVVPWQAIERVTQARWSNPRVITLHLAQDTSLGRRIRFAPAGFRRLAFWREDEVVTELRTMIEQAVLTRAVAGVPARPHARSS